MLVRGMLPVYELWCTVEYFTSMRSVAHALPSELIFSFAFEFPSLAAHHVMPMNLHLPSANLVEAFHI